MEDKYSYSAEKITLSNISSYSGKLSYVEEQKICEFAEIAAEAADFIKGMLRDGLNIYEAFSVLGESLSLGEKNDANHVFDTSVSHINSFRKISEEHDKSVFPSLLLEYLTLKNCRITEKDFFLSRPRHETFVYVKNAFSDEAYDVFSQDFADPRVRYADSFKDAVRLVSEDAVTFCLLPIEERGVRLPSVEELIFRNDCKINSVIPVFGYDGNADLKYALVSKNVFVADHNDDDDRYFEIRIPLDSEGLFALMISKEEFSVDVYRINTLSFNTEEGEVGYFSVVLKSLSGDFTKLLVFLTLFLPEYTPVGIYKNLE